MAIIYEDIDVGAEITTPPDKKMITFWDGNMPISIAYLFPMFKDDVMVFFFCHELMTVHS